MAGVGLILYLANYFTKTQIESTHNMEQALIYVVPALGLVGLLAMAVKSAWVTKQATGDKNMMELSGYIADGAMAFLKAEWKILAYFAVIAGILLAWSGTMVETSSPVIAISFVIGAFFSALAGYIGMKIATKANVRTTQAARTSLKQALKVSFTGGSVMGLGVAGLAVLGLGALFIVFYQVYVVSVGAGVNGLEMEKLWKSLQDFPWVLNPSRFSPEWVVVSTPKLLT